MIYSFIASRLRNRSEAEEVLQDTFFRIHKYILKYDASQNALGWSFTIAKNCTLDLIAKRKKEFNLRQGIPFYQEMDAVDDEFQKKARNQIEELLANLSEEDSQLIKDRFINDLSYEELAKIQGVNSVGVRQRVSRLIKNLRKNSL